MSGWHAPVPPQVHPRGLCTPARNAPHGQLIPPQFSTRGTNTRGSGTSVCAATRKGSAHSFQGLPARKEKLNPLSELGFFCSSPCSPPLSVCSSLLIPPLALCSREDPHACASTRLSRVSGGTWQVGLP